MPKPTGTPPSQYLSSWKEIANYMGKGVRTVQRYEAELGLPVRRPAGRSRSAVFATRAEIDAWAAAAPLRQTLRLSRAELERNPDLLALRSGIREMEALRGQMEALHRQTASSLGLLISGLQMLRQTSVNQRVRSGVFLDEALGTSRRTLPPRDS